MNGVEEATSTDDERWEGGENREMKVKKRGKGEIQGEGNVGENERAKGNKSKGKDEKKREEGGR